MALVITVSIVVGSFLAYVFTSVDGTMEEDLNDLRLNFTTTIYSQDENGEYVEYQRLHGMYNRIWKQADKNGMTKKLRRAVAISNFLLKIGIDII